MDKLFQKALSKHQQKRFDEAEALYRKVIKSHPRHLDANYLLGTLYAQQGKLSMAEKYLVAAESINPSSPMIQVNLGTVLKDQGHYDQALERFTKAIHLNPNLPQAHFGLGSLLEMKGDDLQKAKECYVTALSLAPSFPEIHHVIGRIYMNEGNTEGLRHLETAKGLDPGLKDIDRDLGISYLWQDRVDEALHFLESAEKRNPHDITVKYFLAVAKGIEPDPCTKQAYIRSDFDRFASTFDQTLVGTLKYDTIQLTNVITENLGDTIRFSNAVDLGCGTGLCGPELKKHSDRLVGIDISEKMLEIAGTRNCYDVLLPGDILETLPKADSKFDLFFAADVFCYLGDLKRVFEVVKAAANDGALLTFTTESLKGDGFVLRHSGRYAHSSRYVTLLANECGYNIIYTKQIHLRTDGPEWIMGDMFLLKLER